MAAYKSTCNLSFDERMTLSLTVDAARLGNPAGEVSRII